jgi:hypothetical protein
VHFRSIRIVSEPGAARRAGAAGTGSFQGGERQQHRGRAIRAAIVMEAVGSGSVPDRLTTLPGRVLHAHAQGLAIARALLGDLAAGAMVSTQGHPALHPGPGMMVSISWRIARSGWPSSTVSSMSHATQGWPRNRRNP